MDTKSKNISRNKIMKLLAFIIVVVLITAIFLQGQYLLFLGLKPETLIIKEYKNSGEFQRISNRAIHDTSNRLEFPEEGFIDEDMYYYYISDGKDKTYTNVEDPKKEFFESHKDAFYGYEKGEWLIGENTNPGRNFPFFNFYEEGISLYVAFPDEFLDQGQAGWEKQREEVMPLVSGIVFSFVLSLALIIYLFIVTGRKPDDEGLHLMPIDRIYSDILMAVLIIAGLMWLIIVDQIYPYNYMNSSYGIEKLNSQQIYYMVVTGAITTIVTTVYGVVLLSLGRKFKGKNLIKHSLIYRVFYRLYDFARSFFDGRRFERYPLTKSLFYRQMVFISASGILVFLTFISLVSYYGYGTIPWFIVPPILEIIIIYWYIKGNNKTFEDINKGFNESIEDQMKAERMKIDLVTNVSHDLKTPLTSIISYVDLLSKEEDLSETARDYVGILSDKSNRLKQIVADLFDLAKSTSGDIQLDLETLDMKKLIEQTIGDMSDEIEKSGLQIRTKLPSGAVNILSDGKKLYRVFQNIVDNALKYSHKGTRVYIELEEINGKALATIKNTAAYEMNFSPEEILQRFTQGDRSRSTEGSGLGLSIAESFTHVSGGTFDVEIDGDLFKVMISYPLVQG